jgi:hypothetical protein
MLSTVSEKNLSLLISATPRTASRARSDYAESSRTPATLAGDAALGRERETKDARRRESKSTPEMHTNLIRVRAE